jgi:hypothetical protein
MRKIWARPMHAGRPDFIVSFYCTRRVARRCSGRKNLSYWVNRAALLEAKLDGYRREAFIEVELNKWKTTSP